MVICSRTTPWCKSLQQQNVILALKTQQGKIFQCCDAQNKHFIHSKVQLAAQRGEEKMLQDIL